MNNPFWNEVFDAWIELNNYCTIKTNEQLLTTPIWYNQIVSVTNLFFPKWINKGIKTVGDIVGVNGASCIKENLN